MKIEKSWPNQCDLLIVGGKRSDETELTGAFSLPENSFPFFHYLEWNVMNERIC